MRSFDEYDIRHSTISSIIYLGICLKIRKKQIKCTCCWLDDWHVWLLAHWCSVMIESTVSYSGLVIGTYCGVAFRANHSRYLLVSYTNLGTITVDPVFLFLKGMFCTFASSAWPRRRTHISHFRSEDHRQIIGVQGSFGNALLNHSCWAQTKCDDSWARGMLHVDTVYIRLHMYVYTHAIHTYMRACVCVCVRACDAHPQ